jgi:hypothetical protein
MLTILCDEIKTLVDDCQYFYINVAHNIGVYKPVSLGVPIKLLGPILAKRVGIFNKL